jgi:hypothetical protein
VSSTTSSPRATRPGQPEETSLAAAMIPAEAEAPSLRSIEAAPPWAERRRWVRPLARLSPTAAVLLVAAGCALLLALPGQTVTTRYVNDLLIFLDAAYRIAGGQVPNRDFHSALGPVTYYIPALGYSLTGQLGSALPVGMALTVVALAFPIAHICASRLRPAIALPFAAFLVLITAVPMNLGEGVFDLSFAMFYNRIGWAALAALLVMHLAPASGIPHQTLVDALWASVLVLVLVYTKASYAAVALVFLLLVLLDRRARRWAALALLIVASSILVVELAWGATATYVADIMLAAAGTGLKDWRSPVDAALHSLPDIVLFAFVSGLALWRAPALRHAVFYVFCVGAGLAIVTLNAQVWWGIVTLQAGAAVAGETLARSRRSAHGFGASLPGAAPLLSAAMLLPQAVHCAAALTLHVAVASGRLGEPFGLPNYDAARLASIWVPRDHARMSEYLDTLQNGAVLLRSLNPPAERVFVLDFVSPFSSALGLKPPSGDTAWMHLWHNFDEEHYLPPSAVLRDVQIVMEPKIPVEPFTAEALKRLYRPYIEESFSVVADTAQWTVLRRSNALPTTN